MTDSEGVFLESKVEWEVRRDIEALEGLQGKLSAFTTCVEEWGWYSIGADFGIDLEDQAGAVAWFVDGDGSRGG